MAMEIGLAVALGAAGLVLALWALGQVRRLDREYDDRLNEKFWELSDELRSGFEAIGLEREPAKPAQSPSWKKAETTGQ